MTWVKKYYCHFRLNYALYHFYTNTPVIYCNSTIITKVMLFYNTEWQYDHGMAINYCGKKFYNIGPRAEFSILEVAICRLRNFGVISKTAWLQVKNSAQTTFRFSLFIYGAPWYDEIHIISGTNLSYQDKTWAEFSCVGVRISAQHFQTFCGRNLQIFIISLSVFPWHALPAWPNVCG